MAQFAVHIASGFACGYFREDNNFKSGSLAGSVLPDFDFIPMLILFPFNSDLALGIHRTASHSLLLPIIVSVLCLILYSCPGTKKLSIFISGAVTGIALHIFMDIIFWFDRVDLLWPLTFNRSHAIADIWSGIKVPEYVKNIAGPSLEFFFYGFLFKWLNNFKPDGAGFIERNTGILKMSAFTLFAGFLCAAFILPAKLFAEIAYAVTSFTFAPVSLFVAWSFRKRIFIYYSESALCGDLSDSGSPEQAL